MRIYYIFNVRSEYYEMYKDYPRALYNMFLEIYELNKKDLDYGFNLFKQIALPINKKDLDERLQQELKNEMRYSQNSDEHIINDLYSDEISIMKIKRTHIIININHNYTEFFELLNKDNIHFFACDFKNDDYFFLSSIKALV